MQDVVDLVADGLLDLAELAEPPPHLAPHLGQPLRAEHQQRDDEDDEDLGWSELGHRTPFAPWCGGAYRWVGSAPGSVSCARRSARRSRSERTVTTSGTRARSAWSNARNRSAISRRRRADSRMSAAAPATVSTAMTDTIAAGIFATLVRQLVVDRRTMSCSSANQSSRSSIR